MELKRKRTSFFLVLIFAIALLLASRPTPSRSQGAGTGGELWQDIEEASLLHRGQERLIRPDRYRLVAVDVAALDHVLRQAPLAFTQAAGNTEVVLTVPLPDGSSGRFRLEEAPIMAPELAQKLPGVKTYRGFGLDDPTASGRFDRTPAGFHGIIFAVGETVYIDPYQRGNIVNYVSYYKRDYGDFWGKSFAEEEIEPLAPDTQPLSRASVSSGEIRRSYRLAVAATGEYTQFHGGTVAQALAAIVTTMNRVTGVYERELSVSFTLVANNDQIIYTNAGTDPYTNTAGDLGANQANIDAVIGSANYDIGHLVGTGGGGVATLGVVCNNVAKARGLTGSPVPVGDPFDVDFVAHEMGHQFAGRHTFNANASGSCGGFNRSGGAAYEPGSGSTIQAYAGICGPQNLQLRSDDYFHGISFDEMMNHVTNGSGSTCGTQTPTGNAAPSVNAGPDYVIPINTPFMLDGSATDTEALTYAWEEFDLGPPPSDESSLPNSDADGNARPIFRSLKPVTVTHRILPALGSILDGSYANSGESLPGIARTMQFRLTARDNLGGVNNDTMTVTTVDTAGPFRVTFPSGTLIWSPLSQQTVTWNVANTDAAPVSCANVNILLSTDGGRSFPFTLAANTPNDGSEMVSVPANTSAASAHVKVACADNIFFDLSQQGLAICSPLLVDDHETPPTTWSESYDSNQTENHWQLRTDGGGHNGSANYWFVQDIGSASTSTLESKTVTTTHTVSDGLLFLRFTHKYNLENDFDGGVVEINVDGGGWTFVENGQFTKNGYNTTIRNDAAGSPLRNKAAFSRNSGGYIESRVDLRSLVNPGQKLQVRFLQANDNTVGDDGWYVDDVLICQRPAAPSLSIEKIGPALVEPGQRITYTVVVTNDGLSDATGALISDTLPANLTFAGPVILKGSSGTVADSADDLPTLASGLTIAAGERISVTFPVTVKTDLVAGTLVINTAAVTSTEMITPQTDASSATVVNVPPIVVADMGGTDEDTPLTLSVLTNDDDLNGDALSVSGVSRPNYGSAAISGTTQIVYTPTNRLATFDDVFTYTASDGKQASTGTVTVTVSADQDRPIITSTPIVTAVVELLYAYPITATDPDAEEVLTLTATVKPDWLDLVQTGNGSATLSGTPASHDLGKHSVSLQVRDTGGLTHTQAFTVSVTAENRVYLPLVVK